MNQWQALICKGSNYCTLATPGDTGTKVYHVYIDGLVQDCSNTSANALELLQSCTKPSIYHDIVDGLKQERRNSTAVALESCLSCTNPPFV